MSWWRCGIGCGRILAVVSAGDLDADQVASTIGISVTISFIDKTRIFGGAASSRIVWRAAVPTANIPRCAKPKCFTNVLSADEARLTIGIGVAVSLSDRALSRGVAATRVVGCNITSSGWW